MLDGYAPSFLAQIKRRWKMPVYREEDVKDLDEKERYELHKWCFYHDYGNCDLCVLNKGAKNTEQTNESD
jgi:hypothetical protein